MRRHPTFLALLAAAACHREPPPAAAPAGSAASATSRSASAPTATDASEAADPAEPQPLLGWTADEADAAAPSTAVESVYSALERAAIPLGPRRPLVATIFGAKRCLTAHAGRHLTLAACGYEDEGAARAGRDAAQKTLGPAARILLNKALTLAIQRAAFSGDDDAAVAKIASAFGKL